DAVRVETRLVVERSVPAYAEDAPACEEDLHDAGDCDQRDQQAVELPGAPADGRRVHKRPERITPQSSQTPSTPEKMKPMKEMMLIPSSCGLAFERMPIRLEPIRPPVTTSAIKSRLASTSSLCMNSSRPLCTNPISTCPSRICSSVSWIWYGSSRATCASCQVSRLEIGRASC